MVSRGNWGFPFASWVEEPLSYRLDKTVALRLGFPSESQESLKILMLRVYPRPNISGSLGPELKYPSFLKLPGSVQYAAQALNH